VAYQTPDSSGPSNSAVYLEPYPRTGAKFLIPTTGGHPIWSPKGDEIILNSGPGRSVAVPVSTAPRVSFGRPRDLEKRGRLDGNPVTTRRNADMMPDGQTILGISNANRVMEAATTKTDMAGSSQSIVVVTSWLEELRRRVAPGQ
jgi:hypothetical protein